jgi:hypothetical protein
MTGACSTAFFGSYGPERLGAIYRRSSVHIPVKNGKKQGTGSLFTRATSAPLHPVKAQISVAHNWIDRNYQLGRGAANCLDFYNDPSDEIFSTVTNTVDLVL